MVAGEVEGCGIGGKMVVALGTDVTVSCLWWLKGWCSREEGVGLAEFSFDRVMG